MRNGPITRRSEIRSQRIISRQGRKARQESEEKLTIQGTSARPVVKPDAVSIFARPRVSGTHRERSERLKFLLNSYFFL